MEKAEKPADYKTYPLVERIRQSPPVDTSAPYDASWVKGKTFLITGGASGFGAGFVRKWAANGANVIIGDINIRMAEALVQEVRSETGNPNVHFVYCNVSDWQSQVNFFREGVKLSPHGGVDGVVANAGIAGPDNYEMPEEMSADEPKKPNLKTIDVNLIGVLYTAHLALFWLPKNPGSSVSDPKADPTTRPRDRHLLLLGSMASLGPIPSQTLYGVAKHGVLGLHRNIMSTSWIHGIRVNILCPYFIDTPILPTGARVLLAGGALGKPEDVVDAATRFAADTRISGRSLYVGPKIKVIKDSSDNYQVALVGGQAKAIFDAYAHDYEDSELFGRNLTRLLNVYTRLRGWRGWIVDLFRAILYGIKKGPRSITGAHKVR